MTTVAQTLYRSYQEAPDRSAVTLQCARQPDQPISFRQLVEGGAGCARALAEAGIQPGEVVVLILQHDESLVYGFFGAILHGAIPSIMPFRPGMPSLGSPPRLAL